MARIPRNPMEFEIEMARKLAKADAARAKAEAAPEEDAAAKAYELAQAEIARAKAEGLSVLSFDSSAFRALDRLPPEIAELEALRRLDLDNTRITDVSPLSGLTGLRELWLNNSRVKDVSPLSTLGNLMALGLNRTDIIDVSPLSTLTALSQLWLDQTKVKDLRPISTLKVLSRTPERNGLTFVGSAACDSDLEIDSISEIEDHAERARVLFDYLEDWEPPVEGLVPEQVSAPLRAGWVQDRLVELPPDDQDRALDEALAREGWEALREFFDDVRETLRKDNLPNLTRAIDAFGRALGNQYEDVRPIALGTHGQRIIEISRNTDDMLLEDAGSDLRAFAATIDLMLGRFESWQRYRAQAAVQDFPPVAEVLPQMRSVAMALPEVQQIEPALAQKFADLVEMVEDGDAPKRLSLLGVVTSLSNILSPLAAVALKGVRKLGTDLGKDAYKKAIGGTVLVCADLFLNKGQAMLTLAQKFPQYLGWLEALVRFFV